MDKFFFKLDLKPEAQARPRVTRWRTYDPKEKIKTVFKCEIAQIWPYLPCNEEIHLSLVFTLAPPLSLSKRKKNAILDDPVNHPYIKRPDIDNQIKFLLDCMNEIVFRDDSQITKLTAQKRYGEENSISCLVESSEEFKRR